MAPCRIYRSHLLLNSRGRSRIQSQTNPRALTPFESSRYEQSTQNKPTAIKCSFFSELQSKTGRKSRNMSRRGASLFRIGSKGRSRNEAGMCPRINQMRTFSRHTIPNSTSAGLRILKSCVEAGIPFRINTYAGSSQIETPYCREPARRSIKMAKLRPRKLEAVNHVSK